MGTNDYVHENSALQENGVTSAALTWLHAIRTACPSSQIFVVTPFGGFEKSALQSAFTQYVGVTSPDMNVRFINLGPTASTGISGLISQATGQSVDGVHPNIATHLLLGYQMGAALQTAMGRNDFNGDGKSDLILQNASTNAVGIWKMAGTTVLNPQSTTWNISDIPDSNYALVGSGDFNGDGKPDLVFQHRTNGQIAIWYMNGTSHTGGVLLTTTVYGSNDKVVAIGDFNGDGKPDIVLQNQSTNAIAVWYLNGITTVGNGTVDVVPDTGYKVVGAADFNRDGQPDLLFQNTSVNGLALWYMSGVHRVAGESIGSGSPSGYNVEAVVDLDGDGRPDIVLRNSTGNVTVWHVDNGTLYNTELTAIPLFDTNYRIAGPR